MKKILVLATAGAGGDLQPLMAVALGLRERGHTPGFFGDASVAAAVQGLAIDTDVSVPEHDLGPRLIATIKESQGLQPAEQGKRLEQQMTDLPPTHHYVGPLIWEAPAPVPAYLDEPGNPWVLVTLSSQQQDDIPIAQMALDTLAHQPVRVALTIGSGHQPAELKRIPDNARVEQYLPHSKVLERSRLLLSHAGHGSVMKALWYGVPMLLASWGRDQPGVAARAERLGVAKVIARDELTVERLAEAIQLVLEDRYIREAARDVAQRLRTQEPVANACQLLEQT